MNNNNEQLARLPIYLFLWIAGADDDISPKEIETFHRLIDKTSWCKSRYLIEHVNLSSQIFKTVWKQYQDGSFKLNSLDIRILLEKIKFQYPISDCQNIKDDLLLICEAIAKTDGGIFGINTISTSEANAIIVIETLINETLIFQSDTRKNEPSQIERQISSDRFCSAESIDLICIGVNQETNDIHTFRFKEINNRLFDYQAGQFITFNLMIDSKKVSRSYTISSTPTRPDILEVTIKSIEGGLVSNWMKSHIHQGSKLNAKKAAGEFIFNHSITKKALFISAGSGITPVMSMLRSLYDINRNMDIIFLNSCRTEKDIVFKDEINFYSKKMPLLKFHYSLTGQCRKSWKGMTGRLNAELLQQAAIDLHDRHIYLCGPDKFKDSIEAVLKSLNFNFDNYFYESFGGNTEITFNGESTLSKIIFNISDIVANITSPQSLLECAESAGVSIPNACRAGACGSCKVKVVSGKVISLKSGKKVDSQDTVLACCHTSVEDVELEV
ncbi:2Fe-2S iron-sulfur cluster-binding protein [Marinicellulosiphila megalodicopiae]|uniref:2Fe-2S iron-sulfur cluster-binding protein n=1 Tax=Marinicellulosiphila megalodicopiae TaxID=2724896 RepID=UPI003BAEDEBA